eukprot:6157145-Pleurochrysis_carterae.AAC.1
MKSRRAVRLRTFKERDKLRAVVIASWVRVGSGATRARLGMRDIYVMFGKCLWVRINLGSPGLEHQYLEHRDSQGSFYGNFSNCPKY